MFGSHQIDFEVNQRRLTAGRKTCKMFCAQVEIKKAEPRDSNKMNDNSGGSSWGHQQGGHMSMGGVSIKFFCILKSIDNISILGKF